MRKYVHTQDSIGFEGKDHAWIRFDRNIREPGVYIDKSMDILLNDDQFWEVADWMRGKQPPKSPPKKTKKKTKKRQ